MSLPPLRFKNAQNLNDFLKKIAAQGLIAIQDDSILQQVTGISHELAKQFVEANDGSLYLAKDIELFLDPTNQSEINNSTVTFTVNKRVVSLVDIKDDPSLFRELPRNEYIAPFICLNLACYSDSALPKIINLESIMQAQRTLKNEKFYSAVSKLNRTLPVVSKLLYAGEKCLSRLGFVFVPTPINSLISTMGEDILRITLEQNIKLKTYLLRARDRMKDEEVHLALDKWIKEIDENNHSIRTYFHNLNGLIKNRCEHIFEMAKQYKDILEEHGAFEKAAQKLELLNKNLESRKKQFAQKKKLFEQLKNITVYGLLVVLPLLAWIASTIAVGLFIPVLLPAWSCLCITAAVFGTGYFNELKTGVSSWFSLEKEGNQIYGELEKPKNQLTKNVLFVAQYPQIEQELNAQLADYSKSCSELEKILTEMDRFEANAALEAKKATPQQTSVSSVSVFKAKQACSNPAMLEEQMENALACTYQTR